MKYISNSEQETIDIAMQLASSLSLGDVVLLDGYLGAGKTAFTKGIAKHFLVSSSVTSPTFTILNEYSIAGGLLCHIDAYRLKNSVEGESAGLMEFIGARDTITIIEWHTNIKELINLDKAKKVQINTINETTREIIIND